MAGVSRNIVAFKPHQFEGAKRLPRQQTRWMLDFCQRVFRREPDETQQFLDVGCGIGDLTRDELLPRCLPCRRMVAVDVSADMDRDVAEFIDEHGLFDRVYSFHTVTWVRDQAKALKNVARLLKPRGECLFIFPSSVRSVDVNRNLVKMQRWSKYSHVSVN
ncbi:juvenile hormone acid O-methyltransferase-like [Dermacentor albipictus]|uniref:juvenile hormone acid O-methyltransferase-like n=1 Tax=Dermacentor albipictus TaxID=60249 RepID=UPI0038FCD347